MAKKEAPAMEGNVSRAIDFNLKKEDLMLLILEGKKEAMEESIGKLQNISTELKKAFPELKNKLKEKIETIVLKTLSKDAYKLADTFSVGNNDEDADSPKLKKDHPFIISLSEANIAIPFTKFSSSPISDGGRGGTYIKQQNESKTYLMSYTQAKVNVILSIQGTTFAKDNDLYIDKPRPSTDHGNTFTLLNQSLNPDFVRDLPEYKVYLKKVEEYNANETLLSDILAEYDLFTRNQPRAKAQMIKQVLARDEAGAALLENIMTAAKGVKLLS